MKDVIFRKERIVDSCKGKSVLHLGFIQHTFFEKKIQEGDWLHSKLGEVSEKLVGLDYLKDEVELIRDKYGYECYHGDAMHLDGCEISEKFDVIVCGELIEHVENPGLMLDGIKRFMHKDSVLIITTPNPWAIHRIRLILANKNEVKWLNKEHVSWFSIGTLQQILERKGYSRINADYYYNESKEHLRNNVGGFKFAIKKMIMNNTPKRLYDGLYFEVKI